MSSSLTLAATLVAILQTHPLCQRVAIVETKVFSSDQYFFKIRAELTAENEFQVRIYYNQGHIDYAYQLFADYPLLRWDNKEEFQHLPTYPHHHHDEYGNVTTSPLTGEPIPDIELVLQRVTEYIITQSKV